MKNIFLVCGSGASSGFMAASMRKAAKKKGEQVTVKAASESQLDSVIDNIDYLLIGPHLAYKEDEIREKAQGKNVKVAIIPQLIYGSLNGEKALELALSLEESE
ncbi:PTS sugar transporter subunit IIB [Ornithinibacillus bavariensis]|uniref:PTS lactose transporter subunit IIB n=1 Tax=Ornithinibacillus bavariensis TaxID=545502 RepID=A0A919XAA6_9BACI|nr:PTS sugar transporter subunit IIB [Ornithinibacillus bavariensis]GIO27405.1 PTS lactose transporter subunit IIB [Ornithinibacillus bavariensis]HAM82003.1 PTS sugar transporter subunit IIB [Ornithinibacillus sp.]